MVFKCVWNCDGINWESKCAVLPLSLLTKQKRNVGQTASCVVILQKPLWNRAVENCLDCLARREAIMTMPVRSYNIWGIKGTVWNKSTEVYMRQMPEEMQQRPVQEQILNWFLLQPLQLDLLLNEATPKGHWMSPKSFSFYSWVGAHWRERLS